MKNIITAVACLILLSAFIVQFTANQINHSKMLYVDKQVEVLEEDIKNNGCLTEGATAALKTAIATKVGCNESEVIVSGNTTPLQRGEIITYQITYPLKGVIGANEVWGITNEENVATKKITGSVASEYVSWD